MRLLKICAVLVLAAFTAVPAIAQDYTAFVGTWTGTLGPGEGLRIEVDPDIATGGEARYWYGGKGGAMEVELQGDKILLKGSKASVLIGPVAGDEMPYLWKSNSGKTAKTTLSRQ
jgi:hypothetical protein